MDALDGAEAALASARRLLGSNRACVSGAPGRRTESLTATGSNYLAPHEIEALADALVLRLAPGGELIAVHHVIPFENARTRPSRAVALLHRHLGRRLDRLSSRRFGQYVVARWQLRRGANPDGDWDLADDSLRGRARVRVLLPSVGWPRRGADLTNGFSVVRSRRDPQVVQHMLGTGEGIDDILGVGGSGGTKHQAAPEGAPNFSTIRERTAAGNDRPPVDDFPPPFAAGGYDPDR